MNQNEVGDQLLKNLSKHNLKLSYELSFPRYNIMPDEVRLALSVLKTHGMKITLALEEIEKK
jgi:hypothetical protein